MLICDLRAIGNRLLAFRKRTGMTQSEVAEAAGVSDRTYADIERGTVNMRLDTLLRICRVLRISPNEILTPQEDALRLQQEELWKRLQSCTHKDRETALKLLDVFLKSCEK